MQAVFTRARSSHTKLGQVDAAAFADVRVQQ